MSGYLRLGSPENRLRDAEICVQKADWGVHLGTTPIRSEGSWIGQEKLNCHTVATTVWQMPQRDQKQGYSL